jgi:IS4 transposase
LSSAVTPNPKAAANFGALIVTPEQLNAQQLLEAYACRWQVEVLFKSWKSHFQLGR